MATTQHAHAATAAAGPAASSAAPKDDHKILCCLCGIPITPNPSSMCINCIKSQVDISEDISKQETVMFCRECERYLQPPKYWVAAHLESRELMTLCLKRIKGLNKVKLVDASWIWTEPHSRRLKLKLTIQKEVFNGTVLQQSFIVEFIVKNQQCETCQRSYTTKTWTCLVQLRQKVDHKRTFFYLEQLILKHGAHSNCINIKDRPDGIDFYFNHRSHGLKFVDFVSGIAPIRTSDSKRLITQDDHSNTFNYKYTFSSEIAPICREDIICLPKRLSTNMGGIGPIVLCMRVNTHLHFLDPVTMRQSEIQSSLYWKSPFRSLMDSRKQVEFTVLDVEPVFAKGAGGKGNGGPIISSNGKFRLAEVQIVRSDEMGDDNQVLFVRTHLGNVLKPGDRVMGYDIKNANVNDDNFATYNPESLPDVILCHKFHEKKKSKKRKWQLKQLQKIEAGSDDDESVMGDGDAAPAAAAAAGAGAGTAAKKTSSDKNKDKRANTRRERNMRDYEQFLQELEEDEGMRKTVNLYRAKGAADASAAASGDAPAGDDKKRKKQAAAAADSEDDSDLDDDDDLSIDDAELRDLDADVEVSKPDRHLDDEELDELEEEMKGLAGKISSRSGTHVEFAKLEEEDDEEEGEWEDVDEEDEEDAEN